MNFPIITAGGYAYNYCQLGAGIAVLSALALTLRSVRSIKMGDQTAAIKYEDRVRRMARKERESEQKPRKKTVKQRMPPRKPPVRTAAAVREAAPLAPADVPSAVQVADLFQGLRYGVCFLDKEGRVTHCNSRFCEIAGLQVTETLGKKLDTGSLLRPEGEEDRFLAILNEAREAGRPLTLSAIPAWSGTHEETNWNLQLVPQFDQDSAYAGMGLAVEDVSDLQPAIDYPGLTQRLRQIANAHEDLQELLSEVASLLRDFSHCSFVRIEVVDGIMDLALRGETGIGQGLWDEREPASEQTMRNIFEDSSNGASGYRTDAGSLYFADIGTVEASLSGDLGRLVENVANSYGFRTLLLLPLRLGDRAAGFVQMASKKAGGIPDSTIQAAECVSAQLCAVLERALLRSEMQRQRQSLIRQVNERGAHLEVQNERLRQEVVERKSGQEALRRQLNLVEQLIGVNDRGKALGLCLGEAIAAAGADGGAIYLLEGQTGTLTLACSEGPSPESDGSPSRFIASVPDVQALMGMKAVYSSLSDCQPKPGDECVAGAWKSSGMIPIVYGDRVIACLRVVSNKMDAIPQEKREALEAVAAHTGTAIVRIAKRESPGDVEEKYKALFTQTATPITVIDSRGNYVDGNEAALLFLECTRDELLSMNVKDTLPPYLDDQWLARLRSVWETGGTVERDYYVWGKIKVMEMTVTPLLVGGQHVVFEIGKDVTERKRQEQALQGEHERISGIFDNVLDVLWAVDARWEMTYVSPSVRYLLGRSAEEIMSLYRNKGLTAEITGISESELQRFVKAAQDVISDPSRSRTLEFELKHRDGFTYWVEAKMSIIRDKNRQPAGIVGVVRDISQQKKTTERLVSADRLASLGEMAAGLAHEVNNPLTAVMGFAYLLQQNPSVPAELRRDIDAIYREGKRAADVIRTFLLFARGQTPSRQAIYINDVVEAVLRLRQSQLETKNIEVNLMLADDLPAIQGDISQLQQAILNIVLNAEYFMFRAHHGGRLSVSTELADGKVRISIEDDGPGIPSGELNRVFDPFYTTKDVGDGMGLGLSICYGIVREHGGETYAESKPEGGTILTMELPTGK
jgi:PAS domain S-box-containing protein